ncbi:hypothetical protein BJ878DRAFT_479821 [Calycina marina]|uniref:Uncharacterized protein n=1 Tax=Calycina marina TaxID=1763456 RepID=A0A9P8CF60_9HELO|nr:hypothetical protein BJ878DRAFT_479821 [Calycina marina]
MTPSIETGCSRTADEEHNDLASVCMLSEMPPKLRDKVWEYATAVPRLTAVIGYDEVDLSPEEFAIDRAPVFRNPIQFTHNASPSYLFRVWVTSNTLEKLQYLALDTRGVSAFLGKVEYHTKFHHGLGRLKSLKGLIVIEYTRRCGGNLQAGEITIMDTPEVEHSKSAIMCWILWCFAKPVGRRDALLREIERRDSIKDVSEGLESSTEEEEATAPNEEKEAIEAITIEEIA